MNNIHELIYSVQCVMRWRREDLIREMARVIPWPFFVDSINPLLIEMLWDPAQPRHIKVNPVILISQPKPVRRGNGENR